MCHHGKIKWPRYSSVIEAITGDSGKSYEGFNMENLSENIAESVVPAAPAIMEEKMLPQSKVNELIGREKAAARDKARQELQAELESLRTGQTQAMGGMQAPNIDDIYSQVTERLRHEFAEAQQQAQQAEHEQFVRGQVEKYLQKMDAASGIADDFREMTAKFKPERFKEIFFLANSLENTPHVIYELAKNPNKLANLDYLAKTDPELAREALANLSKSIEANEQAKANNVSAPAPIGRMTPSLAGADNGAMSIRDLKNAPWLRA